MKIGPLASSQSRSGVEAECRSPDRPGSNRPPSTTASASALVADPFGRGLDRSGNIGHRISSTIQLSLSEPMHEGAVAVADVGPHQSPVEAVGGSGDVLRLAARLARVAAVVVESEDSTTLPLRLSVRRRPKVTAPFFQRHMTALLPPKMGLLLWVNVVRD